MTQSRRELIQRSAAVGGGLFFAGNLTGLFTGAPAVAAGIGAADRPGRDRGIGELLPDPFGLLDLPDRFRYAIVSEVGEPTTDGGVLPDRFDGTSTFAKGRSTFLVRNHEQSTGAEFPALAAAELTYDPAAHGGTSTVEIDRRGDKVDEYVSLAGTYNNCAGGLTPWGTWLTCEETEAKAGSSGLTKDHGFVFEVDPVRTERNVVPTPLPALGRFAHEATTTDPRTGIVYLTEDASGPNGLVYRCLPNQPLRGHGSLRAGGLLQAMRCTDRRHVRARPVRLQRARHDAARRLGRRAGPAGGDGLDAHAAAGGHPQPQVRGRLVGRPQRLHRVLVRPHQRRLGAPARRSGVASRPGDAGR